MPVNEPMIGEGWVATNPLVSIEFIDDGSTPPNVYFRIGAEPPTLYMSLPAFIQHFRYNHITRNQNGVFIEEIHTPDHGQPLELPSPKPKVGDSWAYKEGYLSRPPRPEFVVTAVTKTGVILQDPSDPSGYESKVTIAMLRENFNLVTRKQPSKPRPTQWERLIEDE